VEGDGIGGDGLENDGAGDGADVFEGLSFFSRLRAWRSGGSGSAGWRALLIELLQFLLGGLVAGVNLDGAAELGEGAGDVTALAKDAATVDVGDGGEELHALVVGAIADVAGLLKQRLVVGVQGGVVVLA